MFLFVRRQEHFHTVKDVTREFCTCIQASKFCNHNLVIIRSFRISINYKIVTEQLKLETIVTVILSLLPFPLYNAVLPVRF